jgi:hypothetical protein
VIWSPLLLFKKSGLKNWIKAALINTNINLFLFGSVGGSSRPTLLSHQRVFFEDGKTPTDAFFASEETKKMFDLIRAANKHRSKKRERCCPTKIFLRCPADQRAGASRI